MFKRHLIIAVAMSGLGFGTWVQASGGERAAPPNPAYAQECGSCHVPYPARLLSAASWQAVLNGLNDHFGSDASLNGKALQDVSSYLEANAGRRETVASDGRPLLRVTETRWFRHEHDEVPVNTWKQPAVKSPSNCAACHTGAEQGNYSEHDIRLPN